ncbi:MAG: hypothetical protein OSB57_09475 [Planctomycetota bacterium]|nr:hypothetical protein [Planctomycetota bacterium]
MQNVSTLIRTILLASIVALIGWWTVMLRNQVLEHEREVEQRDEEIASLTGDIAEKAELLSKQTEAMAVLESDLAASQLRVDELELSMWLVKVDHRLARITVLDQGPSPDEPGRFTTRVRFQEMDEAGDPAGPARDITIDGKVLYVEGLVIKFSDEYVEGGDALRGSSVALFKRVFSENQAPNEGVQLDQPRTHPLPHRGDQLPDPFYDDLWSRFWDYANDPELAASKGVRAIHGEAPSIELREGKTYRIELRSSGGLSIKVE